MDRSPRDLLPFLILSAIGFLALVAVDKPFADSMGVDGWTSGDKAQVVSQIALIIEYIVAGICMAAADASNNVPVGIELLAIVVTLAAVLGPPAYMMQLSKGTDMLSFLWPATEGGMNDIEQLE
jgi:hypothetical protein